MDPACNSAINQLAKSYGDGSIHCLQPRGGKGTEGKLASCSMNCDAQYFLVTKPSACKHSQHPLLWSSKPAASSHSFPGLSLGEGGANWGDRPEPHALGGPTHSAIQALLWPPHAATAKCYLLQPLTTASSLGAPHSLITPRAPHTPRDVSAHSLQVSPQLMVSFLSASRLCSSTTIAGPIDTSFTSNSSNNFLP